MTETTLALSLPALGCFFDARHTVLADELRKTVTDAGIGAEHDVTVLARSMGASLGLYRHLVPATDGRVDVRTLVLIREALGQVNPTADAIFAVQGLGSHPIVRAGTSTQRAMLPDVVSGAVILAFALTEPEAGSDVASLRTTARRDGDGWVLDGEKVLISNVPLADHHVVFANADPALGRRGITAFLVARDTPGLMTEPLAMAVPHPIGRLRMTGCRLPSSALVGSVGQGFALAMETLDTYRISVGAAANGMAARALACAIRHVRTRRQFGAPLADQQIVRAYLAEMATGLDASRLLVARAAWMRDTTGGSVAVEAAMAKMFATESAQRGIDLAVQLHGGLGVSVGSEVERLYREIRPLRIYEGTTEIQKLIIARGLLKGTD